MTWQTSCVLQPLFVAFTTANTTLIFAIAPPYPAVPAIPSFAAESPPERRGCDPEILLSESAAGQSCATPRHWFSFRQDAVRSASRLRSKLKNVLWLRSA